MADETTPGIGYGTQVRIGVGETPVWTVLAGVLDVTMPNGQADDVDVTAMDSPNRTKQFIAGMIDFGEVQVPHLFEDGSDTDVLLVGLHRSGEQVLVEFTPPDGEAHTWAGYVRGYERNLPVQGRMEAVATLRLSEEVIGGT